VTVVNFGVIGAASTIHAKLITAPPLRALFWVGLLLSLFFKIYLRFIYLYTVWS